MGGIEGGGKGYTSGETVAVVMVSDGQIRPIRASEIAHARELTMA
jgi:hypothetical protein